MEEPIEVMEALVVELVPVLLQMVVMVALVSLLENTNQYELLKIRRISN